MVRDEQMVSKQRRTETGSGQKRFQLIGQSWHVKKTCSETVEQIIGGRNKLSAGNVPVPPTNTRTETPNCSFERIISDPVVLSTVRAMPCHYARRFRCSLDDAREELT
jgi:hypothetical protein